ncbi:Uncharacterized protein Adt_10914 [Abeliophyllum distichum]|uniref:Uncharacterized protein n=1 Tax=Abeliophyllum distichum TaxID=126358 RepID=A0ABD1UMU4_9LAMI
MTDDKYSANLEAVADDSLAYAKTVELSGDGKDAWIFDIERLHKCVFFVDIHGCNRPSTIALSTVPPPNSAASSFHYQTPVTPPFFNHQTPTGGCPTRFNLFFL